MAIKNSSTTNKTKTTTTKTASKARAAPEAATAKQATVAAASVALVTTPPPTPSVSQEPTTPAVTGVANGNNTGTKVDLQTSYLALIAGLLAYYGPDDVFALASGNVTRDQLIAVFQNLVSSMEATKTSNQAWRQDVQAERALELQVRPVRANVKSIVQGRFGKKGAQLLKFGFAPAKTPVKTVAAKSAAVAKSEATREARGTKGKKEKAAIKGNVTGVVITPVAAGPSTPVTAPAGATAATGNNAASGANGANGAGVPVATASPAATGGTPPHS